jgi:hypothetical protein
MAVGSTVAATAKRGAARPRVCSQLCRGGERQLGMSLSIRSVRRLLTSRLGAGRGETGGGGRAQRGRQVWPRQDGSGPELLGVTLSLRQGGRWGKWAWRAFRGGPRELTGFALAVIVAAPAVGANGPTPSLPSWPATARIRRWPMSSARCAAHGASGPSDRECWTGSGDILFHSPAPLTQRICWPARRGLGSKSPMRSRPLRRGGGGCKP